jgi:hypothetical protein
MRGISPSKKRKNKAPTSGAVKAGKSYYYSNLLLLLLAHLASLLMFSSNGRGNRCPLRTGGVVGQAAPYCYY